MQAKKPQPRMVEVPKPLLRLPMVASAMSSSLSERPERTSTSPVRMNSGMAISAKASMPENSASPNSVSGITSVITSRPMAPNTNATQTGTEHKTSSTHPSSRRPQSHPHMSKAAGPPQRHTTHSP